MWSVGLLKVTVKVRVVELWSGKPNYWWVRAPLRKYSQISIMLCNSVKKLKFGGK